MTPTECILDQIVEEFVEQNRELIHNQTAAIELGMDLYTDGRCAFTISDDEIKRVRPVRIYVNKEIPK